MAKRRGRRPWGVEQERLHPRDDRGRFAKKGGQKWAGRVLSGFVAGFGDLSAHQDGGPSGRPLGRGPSGLIDVKGIHAQAKQDANIKKILAEYEQDKGGKLTRLDDIQTGKAEVQDPSTGTWHQTMGSGRENGEDYLLFYDTTGARQKVTTRAGGVFMVRQAEPLRAKVAVNPQAEAEMDAWRADAAKPPPFAIKQPTVRERRIADYEEEAAKFDAQVADVRKRLMREARKRYPAGYFDDAKYERESRKRFVEQELQYSYEVSQRDYHRREAEALRTGAPDEYLDSVDTYRTTAVPTGPVDPSRPLAVYGDMLHAMDYSQASHRALSDLSKIPVELHQIVAGEMFLKREKFKEDGQGKPGAPGVFVGSVPVSELDSLDDLKGERPRGWGEKNTFEDVDGVFRPQTLTVAVGHTHNAEHRDHSAAEHEFGHALDQALGNVAVREGLFGGDRRASLTEEFKTLHGRMAGNAGPGINPYFLQKGEAGPVEFFAEAFAVWGRKMAQLKGDTSPRLGNGTFYVLMRKFDIKNEQIAIDIHEYFLGLTKAAGVDWGNAA